MAALAHAGDDDPPAAGAEPLQCFGEALDEVIDPLIAEDEAARLARLEESFG